MAAYFHHGTEASMSDGVQTLYLMNPNNYPSDATNTRHHQQQQQSNPPPPNMLFFNPAAATMNLPVIQSTPSHNHHHQLLGIPIPSPVDPARVAAGMQYATIWPGHVDDQIPGVVGDHHSGGDEGFASSQLGFRRPVALVSSSTAMASRGLSLSLSTQQVVQQAQGQDHQRRYEMNQEVQGGQMLSFAAAREGVRANSGSSGSNPGPAAVLLGSKYLRAAQELLDEVINVGRGLKGELAKGSKEKMTLDKEYETGNESSGGGPGGSGGECSNKREGADQLSTAQRQELQIKKAKLVNMLDAVEQRYQRYSHQMQLVASSFEQAAGFGAAKSYTALALRTISKQFRCLKDAISTQIKSISKSLGEETSCLGVKIEGSRLRYVDHQLRQQRALQHLGMVQHHQHAWRPQRGLPERAVSVLRAWLFEHFLHPYPKDSDKLMLAKQAGLTRSQVSNWFINARVRLWKPMVEEMYLEEIKEQEKNGSDHQLDNKKASGPGASALGETSTSTPRLKIDQPKPLLLAQTLSPSEFSNSIISMSHLGGPVQAHNGFSLVAEMDEFGQRSPKKQRSSTTGTINISDLQNSPSSIVSMDMELKQGEASREMGGVGNFVGERLIKEGYPNGGGGYGSFPIGDLGRFHLEQFTSRLNGNNGVSLTLGLPHCDQPSFLPNQDIQLGRAMDMGTGETGFCGISPPGNSHSSAAYDDHEIEINPNSKRFAAVQLLPDFVKY